MKMIFLSHTSYLLSKITVLWHTRCKIFTSGQFLCAPISRFNYEKSGGSENMFLKTYKKISRFVRSVFAKNTKMWAKMTLKYDFSPGPIIFDDRNLLFFFFFLIIIELFRMFGEDCSWWTIFENAYFVQRWNLWSKSWLKKTQKLI